MLAAQKNRIAVYQEMMLPRFEITDAKGLGAFIRCRTAGIQNRFQLIQDRIVFAPGKQFIFQRDTAFEITVLCLVKCAYYYIFSGILDQQLQFSGARSDPAPDS